ncbi:MAG TPA: trypsin-like peptidase domain-containing protein [Thermoleophilia bacterium]|nr:trypsin-like peptidase domain-containing protein [Thermoleophilia bacterium]
MRKFAFTLLTFAGGAAVAVLVIVLLTATGILPIKTVQTTVIGQSSATTGTMTQAALTTGSLTPEQIYQQDSPGVVEVLSTFAQVPSYSPFGLPSSSSAQALGSGFVVSSQGYILTNAHVVADNGQQASSVTVVFKGTGSTTTQVKAQVVGIDETSDVALLKVDPARTPKLVVLPLGDSSNVQAGEPVVAIGNPLGYDFSVTSGIVSATDRNLQSPNGSTIPNGIQTDAAINEGNSGGPLIDSTGHVIGINEQIASQSGGNQGLGFAVPIDTAASVMKQLETSGKVTYAYLGVSGQTLSADISKALGVKTDQGVLVAQVAGGSPAAKAGIKGGSQQTVIQGQTYVTGGDVIEAIDGKAVTSAEDLAAVIMQHKPGDTLTVTVLRGGSTLQLKATLTQRPSGT